MIAIVFLIGSFGLLFAEMQFLKAQTIAAITRRSNTPLRGWTVCKSCLCGFAWQKYSTTHNLQTAVVLSVMYQTST
jgi:hypothetical protein